MKMKFWVKGGLDWTPEPPLNLRLIFIHISVQTAMRAMINAMRFIEAIEGTASTEYIGEIQVAVDIRVNTVIKQILPAEDEER